MSDLPSEAKVAANRRNSQRSTGPKDTGVSRRNATKHGLLAEGVTPLDQPEQFLEFRDRLEEQLHPVGEVELFLVQRIALCMIRLKRADLLEAEFITQNMRPVDPAGSGGEGAADGKPDKPAVSQITQWTVTALCSTFQRYETAIENKLYRALNQLERLQRTRSGEKIPAPLTVDVGIQTG